ncbi:MAG: methyltransferase domain-containing protein [Opitutales bacterium]
MRFDRRSQCYERYADVQRSLVDWGVSMLPSSLAGRKVLEFGAGTGLLTRALVDRGAAVRATDAAGAMVEEGRRRVPRASWEIRDAWSPGKGALQANGTFDWVASSALLQWAPDPEAVLREWRHHVGPDGKILALLFAEPTLPELCQLVPEAIPLTWRSPEEWVRMCEAAGWRVSEHAAEERIIIHANAHALLRSLHGTGATVAPRLSPAKLRRVLKTYDARWSDSSGDVRATWTFLRLLAV